MTDLVFISFPSESKAEEVRQKILDMQKDYLIDIGDAVIATKDPRPIGQNRLGPVESISKLHSLLR